MKQHRVIICYCFLLSCLTSYAQPNEYYPSGTQRFSMLTNPSMAGILATPNIQLQYNAQKFPSRLQPAIPIRGGLFNSNKIFSLDAEIPKTGIGIGLRYYNENSLSILIKNKVSFSLAKEIALSSKYKLRFGLEASFGKRLIYQQFSYPNIYTPYKYSSFSAGLSFYSQKLIAGIAFYNVIPVLFPYGSSTGYAHFPERPTFLAQAGYFITFKNNPDFLLFANSVLIWNDSRYHLSLLTSLNATHHSATLGFGIDNSSLMNISPGMVLKNGFKASFTFFIDLDNPAWQEYPTFQFTLGWQPKSKNKLLNPMQSYLRRIN